MPPTLEGVDIKLRRSDEKLGLIHAARNVFFTEGREIVGEFDPESGDYIFRVTGSIPSYDWGVTVGEFAHLLRSSLDNLLWNLILRRGGTPKEGITQFPIYEKETKWDRESDRLIDGVLPPDRAFIYSTQPFQAGRDEKDSRLIIWHPLAMLGHLNNLDKHRAIHASYAAASVESVTADGRPEVVIIGSNRLGMGRSNSQIFAKRFPLPFSPDNSVTGDRGLRLGGSDDDPAEIVRVLGIETESSKPKMEMKPSPLVEISFSGRERPMHVGDFVEIRGAVGRIVNHFRPVFESAHGHC